MTSVVGRFFTYGINSEMNGPILLQTVKIFENGGFLINSTGIYDRMKINTASS